MLKAELPDILTDFGCLSLVKEITKFILYRKQQIPFAYDKMTVAVKQKQNVSKSEPKVINASERLFRNAKNAVNSLEEIFEKLEDEFVHSSDFHIREVALLLGGSVVTPKQVYRIEIPPLEKGHCEQYHSNRSSMAEILRLIVSSNELDSLLTKPVEPTNLFILLRKEAQHKTNSWLLPQPRYTLPKAGQHFVFTFDSKTTDGEFCRCKGFQIYADSSLDNSTLQSSPEKTKRSECSEIWYQAPVTLKGFKDICVKGRSVSYEWMNPLPSHELS